MTPIRTVRNLSLAALLLPLAACGGSKPKAEAPPAPSAEAPAPPESAAPAPEASAAPAEAPESAASEPAESKPEHPPIDVISAPKVAFVIDFGQSDLDDAAEKKCKNSDPAKENKCKSKKREEFPADVIEFQNKSDKITLIIYKRKGQHLTKLSSTPVKLTQKSDNSVTVEILGEDKKPRVLFTHAHKFEVKVPNDYSIEMQEPTYGKLAYDAKIGIVGE